MKKHWIAIDWGTTNFRAFLIDDQQVIEQTTQPCGLLSVTDGAFASTLENHLAHWLKDYGALPILMAGMVGSQQGWHEVGYASVPASAKTLSANAFRFATPWGSQAWIIPGVSSTSQYGLPDVMRGEEVQLIGLSALYPDARHDVILPGTHSKHASLIQGAVHHFSTFMTGELFSILSQHSLLGRALPEQQNDKFSFVEGVHTAALETPFSHLIFSARTRRLAGTLAPEHVHSYLSGLLIGYELAALPTKTVLWVVGSSALNTRYQLAAQARQLTLQTADGDACFLRGMSALRALLQETHP
jgi:2-dehydro-3-deoxygalactonokinase